MKGRSRGRVWFEAGRVELWPLPDPGRFFTAVRGVRNSGAADRCSTAGVLRLT
jgi:hypothetical protein